MTRMHILTSTEIISTQDLALNNPDWPDHINLKHQGSNTLYEYIETNHFFNTKLWKEEDLARRKKVSDSEIAKNKRAIDLFNQQRNDYIEKIDNYIIESLPNIKEMQGKQNSETPGAMIDRLSILSLKIFHMSFQAQRKDTDMLHVKNCKEKLIILNQQRLDLGVCFDELLNDCYHNLRYFKQYRQFKMYNDPNLNPQIYSEK